MTVPGYCTLCWQRSSCLQYNIAKGYFAEMWLYRGKKKEQLLQCLSSKSSNYNGKSNYLIRSGQKSFSSDICPVLWHEGWSWSSQTHLFICLLSHPIKPLSYSQTLVQTGRGNWMDILIFKNEVAPLCCTICSLLSPDEVRNITMHKTLLNLNS